MSITDRDRKVLMIIAPLLLLLVYWFVFLSPKRAEVTKANTAVTDNQTAYNQANDQLTQLKSVRGNFQTEYASVVRLGKAIPSNLDMPSLLVQLDSAARGTGIKFDKISAGTRTAAPTPAATTPPAGGQAPAAPGGSSQNAAAAGGQAAQTGVGQTAEKAGNAVNAQNQSSDSSGQLNSQTATSTRPGGGGLPVGGGGTAPGTLAADGSTSGVAGLDSVPLDLDFSGTYFALSNFLHRMKRFVKVNNQHIAVSGRLITIDGLDLKLTDFGGKLTASMRTTVYLVPKDQGVAAGATPDGPGATPAAATAGGAQPTPTQAPASGSSVNPPAAAVTP